MSHKPLGRKNYGSIPHLPGSRRGPGDHSCHEGQARIATQRERDKFDEIIVQEKLDGSNVGIARIGDIIYPLTRAGYLANTSPFEQHHRFSEWAYANTERFMAVLEDGERVVGEWLIQAHGTRYALEHEPFVAFDCLVATTRLLYDEMLAKVYRGGFVLSHLLHRGPPLSIPDALRLLGENGHHGALDAAEGAVWRVERKGKVDFLVKYVRPDKVDGKYLPEVSGGAAVWNSYPCQIVHRVV